jgi:ketopantoate reductase
MDRLSASARLSPLQPHGGQWPPPSAAAAEADSSPRMSVRRINMDSIGAAEGAIVFSGGSGSQGAALALQAARSKLDGTHNREVVILARDVQAAEEVRVTVGDDTYALKEQGVRFVDSLDSMDPARTIVISTVPSTALQAVLKRLPAGLEGVIATYNGVPPELDVPEPDHGVSIFTTGAAQDGKGFTLNPGGQLKIGTHLAVANDLRAILGGKHITVNLVDAPVRDQWAKIALNTTLNSLSTIFGIPMGELVERAKESDSYMCLMRGVASEVCQVAQAVGHPLKFASVMEEIMQIASRFPQHPTSMGTAFRAGKEIEVNVLSDRITAKGISAGISTPSCAAVSRALHDLLEIREDKPVGPDFDVDERVRAIRQRCLDSASPPLHPHL